MMSWRKANVFGNCSNFVSDIIRSQNSLPSLSANVSICVTPPPFLSHCQHFASPPLFISKNYYRFNSILFYLFFGKKNVTIEVSSSKDKHGISTWLFVGLMINLLFKTGCLYLTFKPWSTLF